VHSPLQKLSTVPQQLQQRLTEHIMPIINRVCLIACCLCLCKRFIPTTTTSTTTHHTKIGNQLLIEAGSRGEE
jgi:hypothetical protein